MKLLFSMAASAVIFGSVCSAADVTSVWQVKSDSTSIYFAGSMPLLRESDMPLPPQYKQAFDASGKVIFEVDPQESNDEEAGQKIIKQGMYTDAGSIDDDLSKKGYKALGDFLEGNGAPREGMDQFRPWFASIMIGMTEMIKQGARPDLGVGEMIQGWALVGEKPTAGLEKMSVEIDALRGLPKEAHEHMLMTLLEDLADTEKLEKEFDAYLKAWRAGDRKKMKELDSSEETEMDEMMEKKLVRDRADRWMKKFEEALADDEPTMYVVGMGLLMGDGNLLEKLAAKGYTVEQMKAAKPEKKKEKKGDEKKKPALIPVVFSY